jgi:hypothetical protein
MGWVVNTTPQPPYYQERDPVPIVQGAWWAPGLVWTGVENLSSDHLAYGELLCNEAIRGPISVKIVKKYKMNHESKC